MASAHSGPLPRCRPVRALGPASHRAAPAAELYAPLEGDVDAGRFAAYKEYEAARRKVAGRRRKKGRGAVESESS